MDTLDIERRQKRTEYLEKWYQTEKSSRRIGAVILFFTAAVIAVYDKPGDGMTAFALSSSIAGSITLLLLSRQPRTERTSLHFLKAENQSALSNYAGMAAVLLFTLFSGRPLAIIAGGILLMLSFLFQWRAYKVKQFDTLFNEEQAEQELEGDNRL